MKYHVLIVIVLNNLLVIYTFFQSNVNLDNS